MSTKKHNSYQLVISFEINNIQSDERIREIKRAKNILIYVNQIHQCLDNIYEHLVDREYQDFKDEVEAAIEHLEYIRDNGDKKF